MNKKIFRLVFAICLMIIGGVFSQNVNAAENMKDEIEANLVGTLSKPGDSVPISIKQAYENKYVKYVSSTDDTVIVYTDSDKIRPDMYIYDKDGNFVRKCICNISDPMKTGSEYNIGTLVKVKKGSTYYFECGMEDEITDNYNIKVAKVPEGYDYGCSVWVYERNTNTGYETSHALDLENYKNVGLTYDKKTKVFTLNNYKGNNGFYIYGYPDILSDEPVVEIKVVGENVIKSSCINEGIIKIDAPVKITGKGTLTFDDYTAFEAARFIRTNIKKLIRDRVGDYLCSGKDFNKKVLTYFINSFDFSDHNLLDAMKVLFYELPLSGEAQVIDRVVQTFGEKFCNLNWT